MNAKTRNGYILMAAVAALILSAGGRTVAALATIADEPRLDTLSCTSGPPLCAWMAKAAGTNKLSSLSIPGSHDAGALHEWFI